MLESGHRVVAALRDLSHAGMLPACELLPACAYYSAERPTVSYADILANAGVSEDEVAEYAARGVFG